MADVNLTQEMTEAGLGIGALLDSIKEPLFGFMLLMGIAAGVLLIWRGIAGLIKKQMK